MLTVLVYLLWLLPSPLPVGLAGELIISKPCKGHYRLGYTSGFL